MRHLSLVVCLLLVGILASGSSSKKSIHPITDVNHRFVKVDDSLYVDKYEVSVQDYHIFLNEKRKKGDDCSSLIYDSTKWRNRSTFNEPMVDYYFNYPAYRDYPIICITYTAANEFCKWLTEYYHSNFNPNRKYKQVKFRLPTEQEFIRAASSKYDHAKIFYPWGNNSLYGKGEKQCNFFEMCQEDLDFNQNRLEYHNIINPFDIGIEPVTSYQPNPYGIFNIVGNVSEMIQQEHIAIGGDWMSTGYNVRITSKKKYEDADPVIGFRVYMEIIE
jgi:formylglycine-generating enzyme required for sulfatase activity